jgi:hypothetical protein
MVKKRERDPEVFLPEVRQPQGEDDDSGSDTVSKTSGNHISPLRF